MDPGKSILSKQKFEEMVRQAKIEARLKLPSYNRSKSQVDFKKKDPKDTKKFGTQMKRT